jgi:tetratricopeptide (TPR) repeat protein
MAPSCPKCGKEMKQVDDYWVCGNHHEPVFIRIESVSTPSAHPFSNLCAVLPTPIAFVLDEYFREVNPFIALWRVVDAVEIITRLFTIIMLSDILRQKKEFSKPLKNALANRLKRPTLGDWKSLLETALGDLPKEGNQIRCFVSELPSFVQDKWLPALGDSEDKHEEKLIPLRNLIAHAGRLPGEKAQELLDAHRQRFELLIKEMSFLANYDLIACTKEGQIVWLKGLPGASGSLPNYDRPLSFVPEHERVYLVHEGEGLDLFPLHAFADILQWREERYEFEGLGEVAPQIYFRLSDRGYLECIPFSNRAVFSQLGGDAYQRFRDIFRLEEWRAQQKRGIQKFCDELFSELKGVFVGREEHINQVKETINKTSKGVLWISGKPGVGKSALMAKLVNDYIDKTQDYIVIPYFFRIGQAGCSTMDFLAYALERLHEVLEQKIELKNKLPELQQQFVIVLKEVLRRTREKKEKEKKVLFLVDGLDEIYRQEREFLNVLFMTMAVKERIVWVCAGRSEGDLEEALRSRGAVWVFPDGLPPLDEQAIREMLTEHLGPGPLKYKLFERDEGERNRFVEAVTRKSEGLPLYVRMVIEDLKAGRLTVWDEDKLPEGLVAYYDRLLERLRVSDVGTVLTPLFCILAWAKEPITEGMMKFLLQTHHLAGTQRWDELFRRALEHGHLMLQRRPTSDGEAGWTIYHDSFRQHLLESGTVRVSRGKAQERWLEVCKDWKALASQEPSLYRYVLRHYDEHLYDKWRMTNEQTTYDALCQLALDFEFAQAQIQHLPNEPTLPLKTLQLALDVAIKLEDAPMMARLLMEHAKRAQSEEETPLEAWRRGYRERALRMATEIIFERNHKLGTLWGLLLAWVAESEGEREWAKRFLDEVLKRWEGAKLTELEDWQGEMAASLLDELGKVERAIEVAELVLNDEHKMKLAARWASKGLFDKSLKVAEGIEWTVKRAEALLVITKEMARAGFVEQAEEIFKRVLNMVKGIEDIWERLELLEVIAIAIPRLGFLEPAEGIFKQALNEVEGIEDIWERLWLLEWIAIAMAKAGFMEQAKEVFEQALKMSEEIKGRRKRLEKRLSMLEETVVEMARAGLVMWSKDVFEQIVSEERGINNITSSLVWILNEIAGEMARAGFVEQAEEIFKRVLNMVKGIEDIWGQLELLSEIITKMVEVSMLKWVEEAFKQALKAAEKIEDASDRAFELRWIAVEMAKIGMLDKALKVAEKVEDTEEQAKAFAGIAIGIAKVGEMEWAREVFEQALQVAGKIKSKRRRAIALKEIARDMVESRMEDWAKEVFEQALKVVEAIRSTWERQNAFREIAKEVVKGGEMKWAKDIFEAVLKVNEKIRYKWKAQDALREIAVKIAKTGFMEQAEKIFVKALQVVRWIKDEWALALMEIVVEEVRAGTIENIEKIPETVLIVAKGIQDTWERAVALKEFAIKMVEAKMFDIALKITEKIEYTEEQVYALKVIAEGMVGAGMIEKAKEIFEHALKVTEGIENARRQAVALSKIAIAMAKASLEEQAEKVFKQVVKMLNAIEGSLERSYAIGEIAVEMAKSGELKAAIKLAEEIKEIFERLDILGEIAVEIAKVGEIEWAKEVFEGLLKVVEGIQDTWDRTGALEQIAMKMAKAWMFDKAMKIAKEIEEADYRMEVIEEIAVEMARAGEVEGVVSIIEREMAVRTEMLPSVLEALVERAKQGDGRSKEGFLRLLPWCGWSLELAYKACGWLAWLYPEHGLRIAEEIIGENLSG